MLEAPFVIIGIGSSFAKLQSSARAPHVAPIAFLFRSSWSDQVCLCDWAGLNFEFWLWFRSGVVVLVVCTCGTVPGPSSECWHLCSYQVCLCGLPGRVWWRLWFVFAGLWLHVGVGCDRRCGGQLWFERVLRWPVVVWVRLIYSHSCRWVPGD